MEMEVMPACGGMVGCVHTEYRVLTLHCGGHSVDGVEHVGQHQEEGDQQSHPARDYRWGDQEADP